MSFLKEKNTGIAELKLMVANAKEEAQGIISAATKEASEIQHKVENENEAKITAANTKISMARKTSEKETEEYIERSKAEIMKQVRDQELILARKNKETDERSASERKNIEDESRLILTSARERAQAIIETANNEKNYKFIELKALEGSMLQSARQSVAEMTSEAEKISLKIVEEARLRAKNVEKSVESIIAQATDEALKIKADADAYSIKIRRDLPDPANWDAELAKIRQQEQDRLQALIEPTVKNYLKAIDMALNEIFVDLPTKFHSNKVIQDFAKAVSNIQYKKEQIKFSDLIPKLSNSSHTGTSLPPLKKSS
ncbi:MAG: hypothetical protein NTX25_21060 [Proteobacteria bacterium]|nr:hypothetical protein [Pseudomonadota bacterium]